MATATFDTRQAVRALQAAGFDEDQADAVVDTMSSAFSETVATKADIAEVKAEIAGLRTATTADIAALEASTKSAIAALEASTKSAIAALEASTKSAIAALEASTRADIADLKAEMANLKAEMFRALWIQGGGIVALIVGLLKFT